MEIVSQVYEMMEKDEMIAEALQGQFRDNRFWQLFGGVPKKNGVLSVRGP